MKGRRCRERILVCSAYVAYTSGDHSNYFRSRVASQLTINDGLCLLFLDLEHCTDEYITRFLLARKYRTEQAAALIAAYQAQITHRQDIFGNLTARDPALQRALRAGIPGVLPARDRYERYSLAAKFTLCDVHIVNLFLSFPSLSARAKYVPENA